MKIFIRNSKGVVESLDVQENETIQRLKDRIKNKFNNTEDIELIFNGNILEDEETISDYEIEEGNTIMYSGLFKAGGCIDYIKDDIDLNIGFDMNLVKRDELYINLIHFDLAMTNSENYGYFNKFKVDVVGGFYAIDDLEILKNYLQKVNDKNIPFIVITSGSSGKDVIPICKKFSLVKEIIIFCRNYEYNKHYINEYPGYVKKVCTSISSVYDYIKTFGANKYKDGIVKFKFSQEEIKMDRQVQFCPVITSKEYDNCYFLIHRAFAHFFGNINDKYEKPKFNSSNLAKIRESLNKVKDIKQSEKNNLLNIFENLAVIKDNNTFVEKSIRYYTGESKFCYLFNRMMRSFEPGLIDYSYYMGPLLYGLNKYVLENPDTSFSKSMNLYRILSLSEIEFYLYKINLNHIICFPSLNSTSLKEKNFTPTSLSQSVCSNYSDKKLNIKMIFKYKHDNNNKSPGIILDNNEGHDGKKLSLFPNEREVILFPFTFARIKSINSESFNEKTIELEIINKTSYIEYTLKNDVKNRPKFSDLD